MEVNIGNVCRNESGQLGIVFQIRYYSDNKRDVFDCYTGQTLMGKYWQSVNPVKIADYIDQYLYMEQDEK